MNVKRILVCMGRGPERTLREVGQIMGVSHETVRQIEAKALLNLETALAEKGFDDSWFEES